MLTVNFFHFNMSDSALSFPFVYYTVQELSMVKDVRVMRNTKVKAIGYICNKYEPYLKESPDSSIGVQLNLDHVDKDITEIYPYLLFGFLCTVNSMPVIAVKCIKRFESCQSDLAIYRKQCLALRNRIEHFDDIVNLAKINGWIENDHKDDMI